MQIINDIISFLKTLSFVDVVFFFAVLALMLLVIVLIYFIRENNIEDDHNVTFKKDLSKPEIDQNNEEIVSLKEITEALENAEPSNIDLNKYEEEQEEKAIISYDELLKRKNDFAINYTEEEDLVVKKVDLDNLINKDVIVKPEIKVSVISYEKEEAFLEALKQLQQTLN